MLVNQYRQDVIANNLANVDTAGFKRDIPSFSERLVEARLDLGATRHRVLDSQTGGIWSAPTHTDWEQGPLDATGNPLDAAIDGTGFFAVQTDEGVRYTRDGQFVTDPHGRLVMAQGGWPVLSRQGGQIVLSEDAGRASLSPDGRVMVNGQAVAEVQVVGFDDPDALRKVGRNLVESEAEPRPIDRHLRSGVVEKSNVDAVAEMASMIEASRAYQINVQMITMQDTTLERLVNEVARPQ